MKFKNSKFKAAFRKWMLAFVDITLFAVSNFGICYVVGGGEITRFGYHSILWNAYHVIGLSIIIAVSYTHMTLTTNSRV